MALRIALTPHESYQEFQALMRQIKSELVGADGSGGWYAVLAANNHEWSEFVRVQRRLTYALGRMDATAAIPGIAQYIKDQEGDQNYDIAAEYTAMRSAVVAIRDWIYTSMPKVDQAGTLYMAVQALAQDGTVSDRTFTPAQTAPLRALIDTFRGTVG
jgi:hypothetical protein